MFYVNSRAIIERIIDGEREIVIQTRRKPNEPESFELPGGRMEPFESFAQALIREVKEETGLQVVEIEGMETRVDTREMNPNFEVECIRPFAAYQTTKGPVDSTGCYFRCKAEGELLTDGDDTTNIRWIRTAQLSEMMNANPLQFSDVDRAGILFYLKNGEEER